MIQSFADKASEDLFNGTASAAARKTLPKQLWGQAADLLDQLNAATQVGDMALPPSNRLEKLLGDRKGDWSVSINMKYRITFTFKDGHAHNVEVSNHYK